MTETPVKDAATIILVRDPASAPRVLMGQRGERAAFMPNKFVFPGGAIDPGDAAIPLATPISNPCLSRLTATTTTPPTALLAAAIRELWEEAGLVLGTAGHWGEPVLPDWQTYAATGHVPSAEMLHFVFRAITPIGQPRRFDARFFLANADTLSSDPDDFSAASDELSHLQWVPLDQARSFDLPFITEIVLAEIAANLPHIGAPNTVPFFKNTDEDSLFERLGHNPPVAGS
ncbi:MAG: NUDIX hydrolase [Paracoccaceae bacterium]